MSSSSLALRPVLQRALPRKSQSLTLLASCHTQAHASCFKAYACRHWQATCWNRPCKGSAVLPGILPGRCLTTGLLAPGRFSRALLRPGGRGTSHLRRRCQTGGLHVLEEVREALRSGKPVVALESTIITHGMPYPHNERTALAVEQMVRDWGAIPATIGVLDGVLCVGLTGQQIEKLADKSRTLMKISRRDLPYVMAQGVCGGTTVAATMWAAHAAGIPIFATGGIGGVHRGVEETMDVSADLRELGRTPVAVVAAGVKSILDIPRTLEYLETEGVCVMTYGPTAEFPAFFAPRSGQRAPYSVQTPEVAADVIDAGHRAQLGSGMLFAVPILEELAAAGESTEAAIQQAVEEARRSGVKGREVTPFILQRVNELTKGASLEANIALVQNNARVAAQIAVALSKKRSASSERPAGWGPVLTSSLTSSRPVTTPTEGDGSSAGKRSPCPRSVAESEPLVGKPVVVGAAVVDFCAQVRDSNIEMSGATYAGQIYQSFGGVGRNVADCLSRLGNPPLFISALGDDFHAASLMSTCSHMDLRGIRLIEGASTPTYCPVLTDSGHLMFGIGDMELHAHVSPDLVSLFEKEISQSPIVCLDGNFSAALIERACQLCAHANVPVWFEPTDVHKACKPLQTQAWNHLTYISPNLNECAALWSRVTGQSPGRVSETSSLQEVLSVVGSYCRDLLCHVPVVMVTLGRHGLMIGCREEQADAGSPCVLRHYPATPPKGPAPKVVSVSGAGDCLNAAMMHFLIQGHDLDLCVKAGLLAAQHSLQSHSAVPSSITPGNFTAEKVAEWARFEATEIRNMT